MLCYIYRSSRKIDTYLYLVDKDDFSILPEDLLKIFGDPEFSFSLVLGKDKKLAMEDAGEVLNNLESQGYHLQLQNELLVEEMLAMKALN
ncbi:MAG: YcgL domain-containing protein [Gammaproteobacteria bacterium]|nr:YcgL domain-containing protein [Gammaproteobacteria bacterium]